MYTLAKANGLFEIRRILEEKGVSKKIIEDLVNGRVIRDNVQAVKIIDAIRRMSNAVVVYEDEEGGLGTEPVYATVILYKDKILSYFSSPTTCFLRIKDVRSIGREISFLKTLVKEYSRSL